MLCGVVVVFFFHLRFPNILLRALGIPLHAHEAPTERPRPGLRCPVLCIRAHWDAAAASPDSSSSTTAAAASTTAAAAVFASTATTTTVSTSAAIKVFILVLGPVLLSVDHSHEAEAQRTAVPTGHQVMREKEPLRAARGRRQSRGRRLGARTRRWRKARSRTRRGCCFCRRGVRHHSLCYCY